MTEHRFNDEDSAFGEWAARGDNEEAAAALYAHFLADSGVEMLEDLVDADRVGKLESVTKAWLEQLRRSFDRWWRQGRPTLSLSPAVKITYWSPSMERDARDYLMQNLPPSARVQISQRWEKGANGVEPVNWTCRIEDRNIVAGGNAPSAMAAAKKALEAWREFKQTQGMDIPEEAPSIEERPPLLDAPSSLPADDQDRQAI